MAGAGIATDLLGSSDDGFKASVDDIDVSTHGRYATNSVASTKVSTDQYYLFAGANGNKKKHVSSLADHEQN